MGGAEKGKRSRAVDTNHYVLHKKKTRNQGYEIYHPGSSSYINYGNFVLFHKEHPTPEIIKVVDWNGVDQKQRVLEECQASYDRQQLRKVNKKRKNDKKATLQKQSGYYCDCKLSSKYKSIKFMPKTQTPCSLQAIAKPTLITPLKDGTCPFCTYQAFYCDFAPGQGRTKRSSL